MRRRTEITIETDRTLLVSRTRRERVEIECAVCGKGARVIALAEAAALLRVPPQTMLRIAESASLHFTETDEGTLFICLDSHQQSEATPAPVEINADVAGVCH